MQKSLFPALMPERKIKALERDLKRQNLFRFYTPREIKREISMQKIKYLKPETRTEK